MIEATPVDYDTMQPSEIHIVDTLIEERAPRLSKTRFWPAIQPVLKYLLNYKKAREFADAMHPMTGLSALEYVSALLQLNVSVEGLEAIPNSGPCIIACNHPTGIADGIAVFDALIARRPDLSFFAISDALRVCPGLADVLIPVEWPPEKRTLRSAKITLAEAQKAFDQERAVVIFPAGALSRKIDGKIQDPEWEHSAVSLARKHKLPIFPMHVSGPRSRLFHFFDRISDELRDITLFHELLNKTGGRYELRAGSAIAPHTLQGKPADLSEQLKFYVETVLPLGASASFEAFWSGASLRDTSARSAG